ncbi:hypothetical protein SLNWT_4935 [Streptomyces albus]|uniref:Uncharacterized protein n=1 Tax=Streptomyces albus (strain ATCC 21838 / DSM 41398 / FERM P-419 / JCM 4703 / NBRC 107858) TaxID=1081613 RepID=A0A0B5F355_STRA4|nr:hypothetical protein SLNWT_4935 [Streptomyces albus]AOU79618.1 hypothetical protein SLNHY_4927 [Streptomyces albus]AYN35339.1 hypothetical protein DUI70_4843 [Streptomyces albus]
MVGPQGSGFRGWRRFILLHRARQLCTAHGHSSSFENSTFASLANDAYRPL